MYKIKLLLSARNHGLLSQPILLEFVRACGSYFLTNDRCWDKYFAGYRIIQIKFFKKLLSRYKHHENRQNKIEFMNWNTIYVKGRDGFEKEVLNNLEHSDVSFMPGSTAELKDMSLFWIDERTTLRDFKKAITSKTILKYRLQFFRSLEEVESEEKKSDAFTPQEEAMIREMSDWEDNPITYKNSA